MQNEGRAFVHIDTIHLYRACYFTEFEKRMSDSSMAIALEAAPTAILHSLLTFSPFSLP